jgi:repressor LexA
MTSLAELLGALEGDYVIRMKTDALTRISIHEGDYLIVQKADTAADGTLVVATINGEATVRRVYGEPDGRLRLEAEHDRIDPVVTGDAKVIGRVIGMARKVQ